MDQNLHLSEEYRQALDGLRFSDGDKARMTEKLLAGEERKPVRRSVRPLRVGLIVACLCVALVGTALAVGQFFYLSRRHEDGITWMDGGIGLYPYESLSEEIKTEAGEYHEKEFDSWQEAEEFIGIDLVNNPLLEGAPFPGKIKRHDSVSGQTTRAQTVVALSPKLSTVYTDGTFRVGNAIVWLNSMLFTDADMEQWESRKKDFGDAFTGFYDNVSEEREVTWETYTAPSGLEAQVQVCHYVAGPVEGDWSYTACFSLNGIPNVMYVYQAGIHRESGSNKTLAELYEEAGAQAREVLYQVLDAFVLE